MRKHGAPPFKVAVIHGGPGAAGEMAPVACELSSEWGVLEPFQTAMSLEGQVKELKTVLLENGDPPVIMIGFSWGAWLSYILAAEHPDLVEKLILVSSGSFEEQYAAITHETRVSRLSRKEKKKVEQLFLILESSALEDRNKAFAQLGALFSKADAYDPIPGKPEVACNAQIFQSVWKEAAELRKNGKLLALGGKISCPVITLHGDYDSHPAEGVQKPLSECIRDFRFIPLQNCGHTPWMEKQAKNQFYAFLKKLLTLQRHIPIMAYDNNKLSCINKDIYRFQGSC